MSLKIGDYVRFINERQEGRVTRILNADMVGVTTADDFEIPVLSSEVVLVSSSEKNLKEEFTGKEEEVVQARTPIRSQGLSLAFVPDSALPYLLHQYLVNLTDYQVFINCYTERKAVFEYHWAGSLGPAQEIKLQTSSLRDLDSWPVYHFQILYFHKGRYSPQAPRLIKLHLKTKQFNGPKKQVPLLNTAGFSFSLDEEIFQIDAEQLRESFFRADSGSLVLKKPPEEVDLHIEQLEGYRKDLSNQDMLKMQLEHFQKSFDGAVANGMEKIIFIHGVGNGVLRHEIHKRISKNPFVRTFKDAGKDRFGYGATEVFLK